LGQIDSMEESTTKTMSNLKLSLTSLLILGACGAVAYNVLALQPPRQKIPGSTAVQVQVKDIEIANVPQTNSSSPIGQLLNQTLSAEKSAQNSALIASIQKQLIYLGFYKGQVDGHNGPQTYAAIRLYQRQNSLKQTGKVSQKLLDHLKFTRKITDAGNLTGSIKPTSSANIEVLQLQRRLILFGYSPGKPDGVFGNSTRNAIRQFEADRSMPITGRVTAKLLQELGD